MAKQKLILNRYRPISAIGSGGFATVQLVWDTVMQRKVALKCVELSEFEALRARQPEAGDTAREEAAVALPWNDVPEDDVAGVGLSQEFPADPEFLHRGRFADGGTNAVADDDRDADAFAAISEEFLPERALANIPGLDEARAVAAFNDPTIVAVYDFQVEGTTAYLSMEYVEGMTLTQLLCAHRAALTMDMITAVFDSVAHALDVAHDSHVLHLDIKPDNVLIDRKGQVKVTDFGLARLADANGFGVAGGGTIGYMPLEQMRQEELDERCDEWALAALTYEMLAGENPFLARDLERAEAAIEDAELVLPSLCWDELGEGADDVLFFALDPDREERYETVAEFAEELSPYLADAKRGKKELAALVVRAQAGDEFEEEPEPAPRAPREPREPFVDRISDRAAAVLARVWAVGGAALVGSVSLLCMPQVGSANSPLFWGVLAACVIAAAVLPHAGVLAAYAVLAAALFLCGAPVLGVLTLVAVGAWWFFVGRGSKRPVVAAFAQPLFGAIGFAPFAPIVAGAFLPVRAALATAAFSAFTAAMFASFGSLDLSQWNVLAVAGLSSGNALQDNALLLASNPTTWIIAASWVLSAGVFALFCVHGTRLFDVLGAACAAALLVAGVCVAAGVASNFATWAPSMQQLIAALVSGMCGIMAAAIRIPDRVRWDDPLKSD